MSSESSIGTPEGRQQMMVLQSSNEGGKSGWGDWVSSRLIFIISFA